MSGQAWDPAPFQDVQRIYHPVAGHVEHSVQSLGYHSFYRSREVMLMQELEGKAALPVGGNGRQEQLISRGARVIGADRHRGAQHGDLHFFVGIGVGRRGFVV